MLEHVRKNNRIIHSFLLTLIRAKAKGKPELTDVERNKSNIINSDYNLIKSKSSHPKIKTIISKKAN